MPWYLTAYPMFYKLPDIHSAATYAGCIWAMDLRSATRLARLRLLGERIVGVGCGRKRLRPAPLLSNQIREGARWDDAMHSAVFLGWAAMRSGVAGIDEILGDNGLVHEIIHAKAGIATRGYRARLFEHAREIEAKIPGWTAQPHQRRKIVAPRRHAL